jgi:hypothetical protein
VSSALTLVRSSIASTNAGTASAGTSAARTGQGGLQT